MSAAEIVNKVWNYAHVLRDDGVGYGDYVEQITYLIFLKMAESDVSASMHVKANVIFFDAKPASKTAWTKKLWVYDYRTNVHKTLKENRLKRARILPSLKRCIRQRTGVNGVRAGVRKSQRGDGVHLPMMNWSHATKPTLISSGSKTNP